MYYTCSLYDEKIEHVSLAHMPDHLIKNASIHGEVHPTLLYAQIFWSSLTLDEMTRAANNSQIHFSSLELLTRESGVQKRIESVIL